MLNNERIGGTYAVMSSLKGLAAFLISGLVSSVVILRTNNYVIGMMISGGLGALLYGLSMKAGSKLLNMTLVGAISMPVGLIITFGLFEGVGALLSMVYDVFGTSGIPDGLVIMMIVGIFGVSVGASLYGRKAIRWFFGICAISAIPFGALVMALNKGAPIKEGLEKLFRMIGPIDLNALAIALALGLGLGLSVGTFSQLKQKDRRDTTRQE